jgi:HD-like signal output (HDOD) protein
VGARLLAGIGNVTQTDEAFVAGLVHDVGLILSHQLFGPKIRAVIEQCHAAPSRFCQVEEQLVGADHQALGAALAARWKFPPTLRYAIACHHDLAGLAPVFQRMVGVVFVADTLCARGRFGFYLTGQTQEIPITLLQSIGVSAERLDDVLRELPERIEEAEQLFAE